MPYVEGYTSAISRERHIGGGNKENPDTLLLGGYLWNRVCDESIGKFTCITRFSFTNFFFQKHHPLSQNDTLQTLYHLPPLNDYLQPPLSSLESRKRPTARPVYRWDSMLEVFRRGPHTFTPKNAVKHMTSLSDKVEEFRSEVEILKEQIDKLSNEAKAVERKLKMFEKKKNRRKLIKRKYNLRSRKNR